MYKYILWDNDGVLVDTEVLFYRATRRVFEELSLELDEAIIVEDTERGLRSAVAAGIDCVIVENDFTRGHDFSRAKHVLAKITDLPDILHA